MSRVAGGVLAPIACCSLACVRPGQVDAAAYAADHRRGRFRVARLAPGAPRLGDVVHPQREERDEDDDQPEDDLPHRLHERAARRSLHDISPLPQGEGEGVMALRAIPRDGQRKAVKAPLAASHSTFPGFMIPAGSSAALIARITSISTALL